MEVSTRRTILESWIQEEIIKNSKRKKLEVKIKRLHKDAVIPKYAHNGDAGLDLTAISKEIDDFDNVVYGVGLAFEIPKGHVGLLFPRSSNARTNLYLTNSVGVLDSDYRGEVMFKYRHNDKFISLNTYNIGDRIGQLMILPYPQITFKEVENLTETVRGEGGYGSTGN